MTTSMRLAPIKSIGTVREQVIQALLAAIERGDLKEHAQLPPERELAQMLGVSRTVTRDAIKTLAGSGVLEVRHGHGTFVRAIDVSHVSAQVEAALRLSSGELADLFEMRILLEDCAAEWAALRLDDARRAELTALLGRLESLDDSAPPDRFEEFDRRFHGLVAEATNNSTMALLMRTLLDLLTNARRLSLQLPGRAMQSNREHIAIGRAVLAGDARAARALMHEHISGVENSLRRALTSLGAASGEESIHGSRISGSSG